MRTPLIYLVHPRYGQTSRFKRLGSTGSGYQLKANSDQIARQIPNASLIGIAHTDKRNPFCREALTCGCRRFGKSLTEAFTNSHHLTGGFHFRPQNGVNTRELVEREYA